MSDPKIRIRRSSTPNKVPTITQLELGELAINTYDGKLYLEQDQGAAGVGNTVVRVNPWNVGLGTTAYNISFTSGKVGIGTTVAESLLDVYGNASFAGDLDVDGHTDLDNVSIAGVSTFAGNIILPDGVSAKFGTDLDGEVKHTGSNLQIQETTGNIQITNYANDKDVVINTDDGSGGTATYFKADGSTGETILYNYGNEKIKTTSSGIDVTGNVVSDGLTVDGDTDLDVVGNQLTITPVDNFNGTVDITVTVSDQEYSDSTSFVLTVNPVNDAPVLDSVSDQSIDEDSSLTITLSGSDIDGDQLYFDASVDGNASLELNGTELFIQPDQDYNGNIVISYSVSDGEYSSNDSFILNVVSVNDAPVITFIDDQEINEDGSLVVELSANDVDGDRTFAEMSADEKSSISHRGRALRALFDYLNGTEPDVGIPKTDP